MTSFFAVCSDSHGFGNDVIPVFLSSASSSRSSHEPDKAKLLSHVGSWCAGQTQLDEYLQLDFGTKMMLTGISSQGHHNNDEYVTVYRLDYSIDGTTWFTYTHELDNVQVELDANYDSTSVVVKKFLYEVRARYLRIVAKSWHNGICLRLRVFGFNGNSNITVMLRTFCHFVGLTLQKKKKERNLSLSIILLASCSFVFKRVLLKVYIYFNVITQFISLFSTEFYLFLNF